MLPSSNDGRALFLEAREVHNRWRKWDLERIGGDVDAHAKATREHLARAAEVASFREVAEYANAEGFLTAEQVEALTNALGWLEQLQAQLGGVQ